MDKWELVYEGWNPAEEPVREALCTLGNGFFATRGAAEESRAGGPHYPGTYLAGGYNRLRSEIKGREVENEDLVNWPNWLCLGFRFTGGSWFELRNRGLLEYRQVLDLAGGVLLRRILFEDDEGRRTLIESRRLVSMADPHTAAVEWTVTPVDWSGSVDIRSELDGNVSNAGVSRYSDLEHHHLEYVDSGWSREHTVYLSTRTTQSNIVTAMAARTMAFSDEGPIKEARISGTKRKARIGQVLTLDCREGESFRIEKIVAFFTSRDRAITEPVAAAVNLAGRSPCFEQLLEKHRRSWKRLWHRCDIQLDGNEGVQVALRLHIFHLLQTVSPHTVEIDAGVPARGLHGEAYRGHVFWDELYILPFLNFSLPQMTRTLLMYRYRRLNEARQRAAAAGLRGALYPWQSGSDGREESQVLHLNPESGRWVPDHTYLQRHVNAAIVYNIWQYYQVTEDQRFLSFRGAEMMLEIARLWASLAVFNARRRRYEIRGVVGPDEYHTAYPGSSQPGLDNNAYTNVMAVWCLSRALDALDLLWEDRRKELLEDLEITDEELALWDFVSRRMYVPFMNSGVISQFEGWDRLEELDWDGYRLRYGNIQRLDRILEAEGDSPNRYKATKQADALMLLYLFSAEELRDILERLGYALTPEDVRKTVSYYSSRTSHGSSLSRVVHSWVVARSDRTQSWRYFRRALMTDLGDSQHGTTQEGIHLGAMAGTTDLVHRCYLGLEPRGDILRLNPCLPPELQGVSVRIRYRGHWISLHVSRTQLRVSLQRGGFHTASIGFREKTYPLQEGQSMEFELSG